MTLRLRPELTASTSLVLGTQIWTRNTAAPFLGLWLADSRLWAVSASTNPRDKSLCTSIYPISRINRINYSISGEPSPGQWSWSTWWGHGRPSWIHTPACHRWEFPCFTVWPALKTTADFCQFEEVKCYPIMCLMFVVCLSVTDSELDFQVPNEVEHFPIYLWTSIHTTSFTKGVVVSFGQFFSWNIYLFVIWFQGVIRDTNYK